MFQCKRGLTTSPTFTTTIKHLWHGYHTVYSCMELYMKLSISPASRCLLPQKHLCNSVVSCKNELFILWIVFKQCWFYMLRWSCCSNDCFSWKYGGSNTSEHLTSLDVSFMQCSFSFFKHSQKHRQFFLTMSFQNKPSVNYAKDWLGQLLLICGLVWYGRGCNPWMWTQWGSEQPLSCVLGPFWPFWSKKWPIMKNR